MDMVAVSSALDFMLTLTCRVGSSVKRRNPYGR
jgi:hypothetical protein